MYLDDRNQLPAGTVIPSVSDTYTLEQFLGVGLTAQVYRARQESTGRTVALKILRHDAVSVSRDYFWFEAQVLGELRATGVKSVPELVESYKDAAADFQFLVLEYVSGQPLSDVLEPLPEQEALELARQALALLQVLHEQVGRTYTDMQLKNFVWNAETQTLKVLDWNHVSTLRQHIQPAELAGFGVQTFEQLAQRDLARFGAYLYRFLTGKGAFEQGETDWELAQRAGVQWERISVAARQIVRRALHPDPARRYATAAEFLTAVAALQERWREALNEEAERRELDNLLEEAKKATIEDLAALQRLDEVDARLDFLERRQVEVRGFRRRLERLNQGASETWAVGRKFYEAAQYIRASEIWRPEAQAQWRVDLWRWVMLAETGAADSTAFETVREALERIVKALEKSKPEDAAREWETLAAEQPWVCQDDIPAYWLGVELATVQQVDLGRTAEQAGDAMQSVEKWEAAAKAYAEAEAAVAPIPYAALLREFYAWQGLDTRAQVLQTRVNQNRASNATTATLRDALVKDFEQGLLQLQETLRPTPGTQEVLALCRQYAQEQEREAPKQALNVVDTALLFGQVDHAADWKAWRQRLQESVRRQEVNQRAVLRFDAALARQDWNELLESAESLPEAVHSTAQSPVVLDQVKNAYATYLKNRDLTLARRLDAVLTTILAEPSEQRQEELQKLQRDLWQQKVEQIKAAMKENAWEEAMAQVQSALPELPDAMRSEPSYTGLVKHVQAFYRNSMDRRLLESAVHAHQLLDLLGVGDAAERFQELDTTKDKWEKQVEALRVEQSKLVKAIQEQEQRRLKAEADAQQAEQRKKRLDQLATRSSNCKARWTELLKQGDESAHRTILEEVKRELIRFDSDDEDTSGEPLYTEWSDYLKRLQKYLEAQLALIVVSKRHLDAADELFAQARDEAAKFTKESLAAAQTRQQQAHTELAYKPPDQDKKRHGDLIFYVLELGKILQIMQENDIVDAVQATKFHIQRYQTQLDQHQPEAELLLTLAALNRAWERVVQKGIWEDVARKGLESGDLWERVKGIYFTELAGLEQRVLDWNRLDFFSGGGQGVSPVVLLPSLKESIDALLPSLMKDREDVVNAALTTSHDRISGYLDQHFKEVNKNLQSLRSRLTPVWVQWASLAAAIILGALLLVSFLRLGTLGRDLGAASVRSQQIEKGIQALGTQVATLSGDLAGRDHSRTPDPTPTPTPTPTASLESETTPTPPLSPAMKLDWARETALSAVPSVTLMVEPGWTLVALMQQGDADSESTTAYTEIVALDAAQTVWHIAVALRNMQEQALPLTGTLALRDVNLAVWQPQPFSPLAGEYRVEVQLSRAEDRQSIQSDSLVIAPVYGVSHARLRVYDPGQPGMGVIYRIINTGNITDAFGLTLYNQKANVPLVEVSGVITLPTGATQVLTTTTAEAGAGLLTFVSPVPGAEGTPQSYAVSLPALGPGQAMDIDLRIGVSSKCPAIKVAIASQDGIATPVEITEDFNNCKPIRY